jgi:hypothetical protein
VGRHRKVRPHRHAKQIEQIDSRDIRIDSKECSRLPAPGNWKWSLLAGQSLGPETALWEVERSGFGCIVGQTGMYRPDETIEETNESYTPSDKGRAGQKADAEEK